MLRVEFLKAPVQHDCAVYMYVCKHFQLPFSLLIMSFQFPFQPVPQYLSTPTFTYGSRISAWDIASAGGR